VTRVLRAGDPGRTIPAGPLLTLGASALTGVAGSRPQAHQFLEPQRRLPPRRQAESSIRVKEGEANVGVYERAGERRPVRLP